jgi:hypothetical protein
MCTRHRAWFLFVLASAGCGLSDYAGQMSSEAARVRAWDEEAKLLGPPIKMPELPKKDDKDQNWNVFLRLPLGVSQAPKTAEGSTQARLVGPLAEYEGNKTFGIVNVYLGVSDQKDFATSALNQFGVSPGGEMVTLPRSPVVMAAVGQALPPTISVKQRTAETQYAFSFNFYEHGSTQVAVIFQMDKANAAKADPAIKASLATLGVDEETNQLRAVYTKRNRPGKR